MAAGPVAAAGKAGKAPWQPWRIQVSRTRSSSAATACTALPVLLVMMAIERIGSGLAAQTGMIGPMSTILMGVLILGEPLNAWIIAGTVLVMGGVFLVTRQR